MQGGWAAKKASTFARIRRLRNTTRPDASAPCAWKTRFAMSNPIVLTCPTDASSSGRSTPPWHADAVRGRPSHHSRVRESMSDKAETAAIRLWRDRAHLREHERDEAQARARIAEEKVAILTAENDRLADEIARLRALFTPDAAQARAETEQQMKDLKTALLALLDQSTRDSLH